MSLVIAASGSLSLNEGSACAVPRVPIPPPEIVAVDVREPHSSGVCAEPGTTCHGARPSLPWEDDETGTASPREETTPQRRAFRFQGHEFSSLGEAACGALLEMYLRTFRLEEGVTFQVAIGSGRTVDFRVGSTLIEYHPPRFLVDGRRFGDFGSRRNFEAFSREYRRLRRQRRSTDGLLQRTGTMLTRAYRERRLRQIRENTFFRDFELLVITSPEELYSRVLVPLGEAHFISEAEFVDLFFSFVRTVARANSRKEQVRQRANGEGTLPPHEYGHGKRRRANQRRRRRHRAR